MCSDHDTSLRHALAMTDTVVASSSVSGDVDGAPEMVALHAVPEEKASTLPTRTSRRTRPTTKSRSAPNGGNSDFVILGALVSGILGVVLGYVLGRRDGVRDLKQNDTDATSVPAKVPTTNKFGPNLASPTRLKKSNLAERKVLAPRNLNLADKENQGVANTPTGKEMKVNINIPIDPESTSIWTLSDFHKWCALKMGEKGESIRWSISGDVFEYPTGKLLAKVIGVDIVRRLVDCADDKVNDDENILSTRGTKKVTSVSRKLLLFKHPTTGELLTEHDGQKVEAVIFPYQMTEYVFDEFKTRVHKVDTNENSENNSSTGGYFSTIVTVGAGASKMSFQGETITQCRGTDGVTTFSNPAFLDIEMENGQNHEAYEAYDYFPYDQTVSGNEITSSSTTQSHRFTYTRFGEVHPFGEACVFKASACLVRSHDELPLELRTFVEKSAPLFRDAPKDLDEIKRLQV